jgi:hypothetical protein
MNTQLLSDSVELLKSIRAESLGSVEDGVIAELDQVIQDLEVAQQDCSRQYNALDVLFILGTILEHVPAIAKTVEHLIHLLNNTPSH